MKVDGCTSVYNFEFPYDCEVERNQRFALRGLRCKGKSCLPFPPRLWAHSNTVHTTSFLFFSPTAVILLCSSAHVFPFGSYQCDVSEHGGRRFPFAHQHQQMSDRGFISNKQVNLTFLKDVLPVPCSCVSISFRQWRLLCSLHRCSILKYHIMKKHVIFLKSFLNA